MLGGAVQLCPRCLALYEPSAKTCLVDGAALVDEAQDPLIGEVFNSYKLLAHVGTGGMARVYRARHLFLDREYAVKVMKAAADDGGKLLERFRREATAVSRIEHDNVVSIVDFGSAHGRTFITLEWIDGTLLHDLIRIEAPLAPERAAHLARQIALGLAAAHRLELIHRDLKPGNVMVLENQHVKILDFGLALMATEALDPSKRLTDAGSVVGTPHYLAPEIFGGAPATPACDLYALGVVLYAMLSGRRPFTAKSLPELVRAQMRDSPPPLPNTKGLGALSIRLLAPRPADRMRSAEEVIAAIDALGLGDYSPPKLKAIAPSAAGPAATESYPLVPLEDGFESHEVSRLVTRVTVTTEVTQRPAPPSRVGWLRVLYALPLVAAVAVIVAMRARETQDAPLVVAIDPPMRAAPIPAPRVEPIPTPREEVPLPIVAEKKKAPAKRASADVPVEPVERVEVEAPQRVLDRALASRGLELADLDWLDPSLASRARNAKTAAEANALAAELPAIDHPLLKSRLARISARLTRASQSGAPGLHALETRYFDLATALEPGSSSAEYVSLARRIAALERDMRALP